jgi:hypothetical protein
MNKKLLIGIIVLITLVGASVFGYVKFNERDSDSTNSEGVTSNTVATAEGCGESEDGISTANAVKSAGWTDNVTITTDEDADTFRFQSNGIPAYGLADNYLIPNEVGGNTGFGDLSADEFTKTSSSKLLETDVDTTITTLPKCVTTTVETSLGRIGVVLNGAQLFNDYENIEKSIVALDDNVTHDHASFVDECNGHPLQGLNGYHYHGIPTCITEKVDKAGQHSTILGVLEDGFPVYGPQDADGNKVTNSSLDSCSGHFESTLEFPNGIYHYHLTDDEAPYSVDCYHGEIDTSSQDTDAGGPPAGAPARPTQ